MPVEYCEQKFVEWEERIKRFSKIFNQNTEDGIRYATNGIGSLSCAYRYVQIHGAVERMGGWANFKAFVNRNAKSNYLHTKTLENFMQAMFDATSTIEVHRIQHKYHKYLKNLDLECQDSYQITKRVQREDDKLHCACQGLPDSTSGQKTES